VVSGLTGLVFIAASVTASVLHRRRAGAGQPEAVDLD